MKIAIDCRYLGMSGIGRFLEGILTNIEIDGNQIYLLGDENKIKRLGLGVFILDDKTQPLSKGGLLKWNKKVNECDCFIIPHFVIPFGVKIPTYTVIHDVLPLDLKTLNKGVLDYQVKKYLIRRAVKKSRRIFTVSEFTKQRLQHHFNEMPQIDVVYNGVSNSLMAFKREMKNVIKKNRIIYIGNIKKHKGLKILLEAYQDERINKNYELMIVGNKDNFKEDNTELTELIENSNVSFSGFLEDAEMFKMIAESQFLVLPSIYEGFGIPPLEALHLKTKPIISDISVLKEIYGNLDVVFFESCNVESLTNAILSASPEVKDHHLDQYSFSVSSKRIISTVVNTYDKT